ncbi:hypothetical protein TgHK011_003061 [Trichoderma gracile]|nr:hypothetical protein TgHK011_003061 [Trichoderma gracile]
MRQHHGLAVSDAMLLLLLLPVTSPRHQSYSFSPSESHCNGSPESTSITILDSFVTLVESSPEQLMWRVSPSRGPRLPRQGTETTCIPLSRVQRV